MQGKGFVRFFTVVLLLVVAYQFILMLPTRGVESDAEEFAQQTSADIQDPTAREEAYTRAYRKYLDSMNSKEVFSIGVKSYTYEELKSQQLALGLDLQGGMSAVLQVDLRDLIKTLANNSKDPNFQKAIESATERQASTQDNFVTLFVEEYEKIAPEAKLAPLFSTNEELAEKITFSSTNSEVREAIREIATEKVTNTFELLKERVDKFGVAQPNISLDKSSDRITVELPGVENVERATRLITTPAKLEFWDVYQNTDLVQGFVDLNEALRKKEKLEEVTTAPAEEPAIEQEDTTEQEVDTTGEVSEPAPQDSTIEETTEPAPEDSTDAMAQTDSNAAAPTDPVATTDSLPEQQDPGPLFKVFYPNGETLGNGRGMAVLGSALGSDTAQVTELLTSKEARAFVPRDARFYWSANPIGDSRQFQLFAARTKGKKSAPLEGDKVTDAGAATLPNGAGIVVELSMNAKGAQIWRQMTEDAAPTKRQVAIVLDQKVYSAPAVQGVIPNGRTQISGNFSPQEAEDLASILKVGKLPARLEIIQLARVGPTLGDATISAGLWSLAIGFILVLVFMLLYYGGAGLVSILALFLNLFFIVGALASLGTVLTLPGIAGIVLTIGMAVDANVIIYERVREELRAGKDLVTSIRQGFGQSYSAIIDANVTTIITAIVLFSFGMGPIKGFAAVLIIGVTCSLFAAVLVGRLIFSYWVEDNRKQISFWTSPFQSAFSKLSFDFVSKRKVAYVISSIIIIAGLSSIFVRGFELGVDFEGGRSYTVNLHQSVETTDLAKELADEFEKAPVVKDFTMSGIEQVKITTSFMQKSSDKDADAKVMAKLYEGLTAYTGWDISQEEFEKGKVQEDGTRRDYLTSVTKVGPSIADDIRSAAFLASTIALIFIFLYIFLRFRRWQYSLGAVAALFHDVLVVVGLFSLLHGVLPFSLEIDQSFIAAILTVIGYSINDTVVVFDRVREYMDEYVRRPFKEVVNIAVNSTIGRTIVTSLTTLLVVLILFLFGGDSIRGFAFALLIGIFVGTYSSVFIATSVVVDTTSEQKMKEIAAQKAETKGKYSSKVKPRVKAGEEEESKEEDKV